MKKLLIVFFLCITVTGYCAEIPDNLSGTVNAITNGELSFDVVGIIKNLYDKLISLLKSNFNIMSYIIIIAVLSAVAENVISSFNSKNNIVFLVFFSLIVINSLKIYTQCISETEGTIENLLLFVNGLFPVMLNSLAAGGGVTTAATLHPILMVCGGIVMMLIKSVILPLISVSTALQLSNALSQDMQATKLAEFINKTIKWVIGIVMTLFVGVVSVSGATGQVYDSISVRAAKYAVGSFIPVVGGVISDSFDLVLNGSSVIKSSVGLAGLINILLLCITPCLKILSVALSFSICAAVVQPLCNKRITDTIGVFGNLAFTMFGLICASACMFILCTGVLISLR